MDQLKIRGGTPLSGTLQISGAKNAALPLMAATLLSSEPVRLSNLPRLADVTFMGDILNHHGAEVTIEGAMGNGTPFGRILRMHTRAIVDTVAPYDMVRKMRASVLVLGPLLARAGRARVSLPGGCAIGARPIDLHLKAVEALGAKITLEGGYVEASAPHGLRGAEFHFPFVSVGATENALMAASLADGTTVLNNAAREPEIVDLGNCLIAMGAKIEGLGTERIVVDGVTSLHGADYSVLPDRIETGSYAVAAAITGGSILLKGARADLAKAVLAALREAGCTIDIESEGIRVTGADQIRPVDIRTQPYPGFPTDMQAQFMALMCRSTGTSVIEETIFENRFMHAPELQRLGANISVSGNHATVRGVSQLVGAPVMATDLRASMSLALAGLAAKGETTLSRLYHLDRGYERLEEKLLGVGADVERVAA